MGWFGMPDSRLPLVVILSVLAVAVAPGPGAMAQFDTDGPGFDTVGRWALGAPSRVTLMDGVAYVAHGVRLEAVDVKGPGAPRSLAYLDLPGPIGDVESRDGYLFVTAGWGGLYVIDARRPRHMRIVQHQVPYHDLYYSRLALAGDVLYAIGRTTSIIDIREPESAHFIASGPMAEAIDVAVDGDRLYFAMRDQLRVFDLTDPMAPAAVMTISYGTGEFDPQWPRWMRAHDGRVYLGFNPYVQVYDLSDPAQVRGYPLIDSNNANAMAFAGPEVYVAGDAWIMKYTGAYYVGDWLVHGFGKPNAVAVEGDRLVVAYDWAGLAAYALDDAGQPLLLGRVDTGTRVESVAADGNRLWLACNLGGVRVLDLSDPAHPRQAGSLCTKPDPQAIGFRALNICPRGDMAVVLGLGEGGLRVVESTPQGTLREVFRAPHNPDLSPNPFYAAVVTSDGWIAWGETGVFGLRLDRQGNVTMAPITWPAGLSPACRADGDVLYAFDQQHNLCLLKATAAGDVKRLGSVSVAGLPSRHTSARDGLLWLGDDIDLQVVDIRDPMHPRLRGRVQVPREWRFEGIEGLAAAGPMAFVLDRYHGMTLAEAPDPDAPFVRRLWYDTRQRVAIAVVGDACCLVDRGGMIDIVRPQSTTVAAAPPAPAQVSRLSVAPNPCNPRAMISFTMSDAGPATVRVFDARGRLVRQLHDGWLDTGTHDVPWSGDDDNGRPVAAGVYLVRATTNGHADVARVTVVK
jgi:hypothetical protein